jgi:hypothetical protein
MDSMSFCAMPLVWRAMTEDEFFVTASAAANGVTITNNSATEPLVVLKHVKCSPAVIGRELLQRLLPVGVFHALKC